MNVRVRETERGRLRRKCLQWNIELSFQVSFAYSPLQKKLGLFYNYEWPLVNFRYRRKILTLR